MTDRRRRLGFRPLLAAVGFATVATACVGGTDLDPADDAGAGRDRELSGGVGDPSGTDGGTGADDPPLIAPAPDHPDGWPGVTDLPDPDSVYDPVRGGETPPDGFRHSIPRDGIRPVYVPTFVAADQVAWPEGELVIGVDLNGEARAYPVSFLTQREIVNDMHRGIPTFVTW